MIHLCTIATLMFLQNNTSQKILSILARTIHSLGLCLKSVSIKFVAIVTSSIYFDVQKFPYLSKIYISAIFCSQVLQTSAIVKQILHFPLFVADYYPSQGSQMLMAAYKPDTLFQGS